MAAETTDTPPPAARRSPIDRAAVEARGLSSVQVAERQRLHLSNIHQGATSRSLVEILRTHLMTLFNLIIGLCALVIILMGRWLDLLFAISAVANVIIGLVQEYSAKRKLDAIALLHQDQIRVLRDAVVVQIHREQIVLDDVVELRRGDQVPADGIMLSSRGLDMDESMLTGESRPVPKRRDDFILSGTAVLAGTGRFLVTAVGQDARAAKITDEARRFRKINSELRRALERIAFWVSMVLIPIVVVVANGQMQANGGWSEAWESGAWREALVTAVSSITAMIPQGLALMTTIAFAVAALKLARQQVLIQEQPAVEILARVDVVCLDKTGTLTDGTVAFDDAQPLDRRGRTVRRRQDPSSTAVGGTAPWEQVLAWFGADEQANPTAAALTDRYTALPRHWAAYQVQFSSARRWSAVTFADDAGELSGHWVLGAADVLLPAMDATTVDVEGIRRRTDASAGEGLRTMILTHAPLEGPLAASSGGLTGPLGRGEHLPEQLAPVAVLTFKEKVRPDAAETLQYFRDQHVALKVISGDSPRTVAAVAREVGMVVEGEGVDAAALGSAEALGAAVESQAVFGRVSPDQKRDMVEALQARGHVVAMTGDGINDALALKRADLGIAMGNGAPATKAVSRMVLLDGRFARLPRVLAEGRKVIANTERVAHLFLTKTAYAIILGLFYGVMFWQFPFLPRQFSTVDFLMLGFPAFFLALMPNPRRYRPGFLRRSVIFAAPMAVAICLAVVGVSWAGRTVGATASEVQTAATITLSVVGLWVLSAALRPLTRPRIGLVAGMYMLLAVVMAVPISQQYHLFAMPGSQLLTAAFLAAVLGCALVELGCRWQARRLELEPLDDPRRTHASTPDEHVPRA